ncbi:MAG: hypothetical protein AB8G22_11640 [Saprospiraceae bacterium]
MKISFDDRYIRLFIGILAIVGFFYLLENMKEHSELLRFIEKQEIDSGTLFYTESEEAGQVEFENMKH